MWPRGVKLNFTEGRISITVALKGQVARKDLCITLIPVRPSLPSCVPSRLWVKVCRRAATRGKVQHRRRKRRRERYPKKPGGALTVGLVRQCQTIHGRDRTCIPPRLPPEWITTLFFIIMGIISLTVTCGLLVASHWRREATKYARWIAFTGNSLGE
ncbi:modulator of smoothened protein isoform X2 [Crotalus tigris]|uniref:modulator of smoothened protein isoform X2 n=1 Tax=Crotalus tigris TaxID=88082 RepID=UPI00192FAE84|nr:modulator of smoothened protein isoform X2 [Crotalus tigris]